MKKIFIMAALLMLAPKAYANVPVDIEVNGRYIKTDVSPVIENGSVIAPVRAVANALGCESVEWDGGSKTVSLDGGRIKFNIGDRYAYVDGVKKTLPAAARVTDGRTLIPVRFVAENFGAGVSWNARTYTVELSMQGHSLPEQYADTSYTKSDLTWLARIVNAEAEGEPAAGKTGVANVVLNRVDSRDFPNNIYDVIFDTKYGVQFTPVANGRIYNEAGKDSYIAARRALKGEETVGASLYFCNPAISTNFWIMNNRTYYKTIGKHSFYL